MTNRIKNHVISATGGALFVIGVHFTTRENMWPFVSVLGVFLIVVGVFGNGEFED